MPKTSLQTIAQLRKDVEKKDAQERLFTSIGLVVDSSNVYRYENSRDFTQKLKIIDQSGAEPMQVYLWSSHQTDFSLHLKVGDVLYLHNFKIELFRDSLQAKKAFKVEDSYFRIFSGNPDTTGYAPVDKKVGLDDERGDILTALNALRKFSHDHFRKNRVPVLFKSEPKKGEKKITSSDFDMILKVEQSDASANHYKIQLTDNKEQFRLSYPRHIEKGVYKIRSVAGASWEGGVCHLAGNDYTYFLGIPEWMLSHNFKEWDRLHAPSDANKQRPKRAHPESKVLKGATKTKTNLKELFDREDHREEVRVTVEVMDVCTEFGHALKKFERENNTEKEYQSESGEYIYSIHLLLSDGSMQGEVCNAYIYTFDDRGLEFLPNLHPSSIYGRNILDTKEHFDEWTNRLLEETSSSHPVELVLSPLWNGKETIYRIVDTELLF